MKNLSLQLYKFCQHLVRYRNNFGIGLEPALGGNHLDKLLGNVHVGLLQRVGRDASQTGGAGLACNGVAAVPGLFEKVAAPLVKVLVILEFGQAHPVEGDNLPVGVFARYGAVRCH